MKERKMTKDEQKTLLELEQQFSRLSSDIDMISATEAAPSCTTSAIN